MRKKGFTLIELLVVIAIIAMLLAILMPALNKVKRLAQRLVCGTNIKGLGTAMMVYAQDFDDEYPMQGQNAPDVVWSWIGRMPLWYDPDKPWSGQERACTVSSSLYLLVRVADVDPKSFVCKSGDETPFQGVSGTANLDFVELWDFGGETVNNESLIAGTGTVSYSDGLPKDHVSYAFQLPYAAVSGNPNIRPHPASATASASTAILADKNPWQDPKLSNETSSTSAQKKTNYMTLIDYTGAGDLDWDDPDHPLRNSTTAWEIQISNSQPHGREGQNVLYGDGHTSFEKRPDISYQNDNIYTMFNTTGGEPTYNEYDRRTGINRPAGAEDPMPNTPSFPRTDEDSLLVNDDSRYPAAHNFP